MLSADLNDAVPLRSFFEDGHFTTVLDKYTELHGGVDRRAAASFWSLYYFSALAIPYIVARRADLVLPVALDNMTISIGEDGLPRAFGVPHVGEWCEAGDTLEMVTPLVARHLADAIAQLKRLGGIAPKLGWNNAAVYIDYAINTTQPGAAADSDHWSARSLFEEKTLPDGSANPFFGCLRHEMEDGQTQCRRKVCCLRYMLPGIPSCGELCALPDQRKQ